MQIEVVDKAVLKDWAPQLHQWILGRLIGRSQESISGSVPRWRLESRVLFLSEREWQLVRERRNIHGVWSVAGRRRWDRRRSYTFPAVRRSCSTFCLAQNQYPSHVFLSFGRLRTYHVPRL